MFLTFPFIEQAFAQVCALLSPFGGMMSVIESRVENRIFDASGAPVASRDVRLEGSRWLQINGILADWAPGTARGWARVTQVEPPTPSSSYNQFVTYAVINDGASPGLGTGDGSIVWMETDQ